MNQEIEEICSKWTSQCTLKTRQPMTPNSSNANDIVLIIKSLESISLNKIEHQFTISKRIYESQKVTKFHSDENLHEKALQYIPVEELHANAQELVKQGKSFEEGLLLALLKWFKNDFFVWVNSPKCTRCGKTDSVQGVGVVAPTDLDLKYGAGRVELHECKDCKTQIRFPRYNHPLKLLETRCGRCGEWANAFTLICSAMGLETRYVLDLTDHVWTEVYIPKLGRWVHADPCEEAFDTPLMYESGWGKQLSFVIALSTLGFVDITPRYTRKLDQVTLKRNIDEFSFAKTLRRWTDECRKSLLESYRTELKLRDQEEEKELINFTKCDRQIQDEELIGRQSGSLLWRRARGEHQ